MLSIFAGTGYGYDWEQLGFYKKSTYQNIQAKQKEGYICNAFCCKKLRTPICLFHKKCTQDNVKCHISLEKSWLRWIVIEQVNLK